MTDEQLRQLHTERLDLLASMVQELRAENVALRAENERLRAALEDIAWQNLYPTMADVARAALSATARAATEGETQ